MAALSVIDPSVNRADGVFDGHHDNQPLDLPPVAEVDVIAPVTAGIRAHGSLIASILPVAGNQLSRIINRLAIGEIKQMHYDSRDRGCNALHHSMIVPTNGNHALLRVTQVNGALGKFHSGTNVQTWDGWRPVMKHGMGTA